MAASWFTILHLNSTKHVSVINRISFHYSFISSRSRNFCRQTFVVPRKVSNRDYMYFIENPSGEHRIGNDSRLSKLFAVKCGFKECNSQRNDLASLCCRSMWHVSVITGYGVDLRTRTYTHIYTHTHTYIHILWHVREVLFIWPQYNLKYL